VPLPPPAKTEFPSPVLGLSDELTVTQRIPVFYERSSDDINSSLTEELDLSVQLTSDMKPSRQCQLAYSTASKVLARIRRTMTYKSLDVLKTLLVDHLSDLIWSFAFLCGPHTTVKINTYWDAFNIDSAE